MFMSLISKIFLSKCLELRTVKRIRDAGLRAINDQNGTSNGKIKNERFGKVRIYILGNFVKYKDFYLFYLPIFS